MEYPDIAIEGYPSKKTTLATLGKLNPCATNCGAFCHGIYWVSRNCPEFATSIINEMLERMVPVAFGLWESGKVTQALLQAEKHRNNPKRRAFEACRDILRNGQREIRKHQLRSRNVQTRREADEGKAPVRTADAPGR